MARILSKILPAVSQSSKKDDDGDDYSESYSYSFAVEYTGPPISREIPQAVPINVKQIPVASKIESPSLLNDVSLPVIQPIVNPRSSNKKPPDQPELGSDSVLNSEDAIGDNSQEPSRSLEVPEVNNGALDFEGYMNPNDRDSVEGDQSCCSESSEIFSGREDECIEAMAHHVRRPSTVTFCDPESSMVVQEEESDSSYVENEIPERPMAVRLGKKGTCYRCLQGNRFTEKETCIVCGAKFCYKCVVKAMGSMPEGRKCVTCIGQKIDEAWRRSLGKSSRMLKNLLPALEVKQIMLAEKCCLANQLPPRLVYVNCQSLSQHELFELQTCQYPPKKLKPGSYWYDKVSGFWGKEGHKPCQIISPQLIIGGHIQQDASNGKTNILINNREITKPELLMLQFMGVKCEGATHFWVSADGSYQEEGMNNVKGKIWEKKRAKLICAALSLPTPPGSVSHDGEEANTVVQQSIDKNSLFKLFLVGYGKSGTSTIFKHAKIIYNVPFSEGERQNIKFIIQINLYCYLGILLEGRERFEEESLIRKKRHFIDQQSASDDAGQINKKTIYSISDKLRTFSDWLLQVMVSGNLETIFPAATHEYGPYVEELWNDEAIQATYSRRNELELLPRAATYFLEKAVEISKQEYEPSDMDILYSEGMTSSQGLSSMEFSFPNPPQGSSCEYNDQDPSQRYQLIRVNQNVLGVNCKWLEMFEDVDMVLFCVSLTDYDEFLEDTNGVTINKMMASKQLFESVVTHRMFKKKKFLLVLNKFDLLEDKIEQVPLTHCEWFQDFNPVLGHNPNHACTSSARSTNTPLAHRAFQYIAVKFKRLFNSLRDGKLFASLVTALEPDNVEDALRYAQVILNWGEQEEPVELSSASIEASTTS